MIQFLSDIDTQLLLWLNGLHSEATDQAVYWLSSRFVWVPFYITIAAFAVWRLGWKRGLVAIAAIGLAVACADLVTARLIRPFCERLRPANLDNPISSMVHIVNDYRGGRYGFPSCHAANSFALATASALLLRTRLYGWAIFCWAALQCFTRAYLGVHYPGDLLVGAIVGTSIGILASWACMRLTSAKLACEPPSMSANPWLPVGVMIATIAIVAIAA